MKKKICYVVMAVIAGTALAASHLKDADQYRKLFGLDAYPFNDRLAKMKIAVLDNGFQGIEKEKSYLPQSTKVVELYDEEFIKKHNLGDPKYQDRFLPTDHGRVMAQLIWAMTGQQEAGPQFYLLNATGITNFRRAVQYAIDEKVDIILYSQNRECCGNFDGSGFLNAIVNQATTAGILWVNAAGNYGGRVHNAALNVGGHTLRIKSHIDENPVQIILNWNSQGPEETSGTDKDLDLFLYDAENKIVAKSELTQVWKKEKLEDGETFLPRERIRTELSAGDYRIVVQLRSKNFTANDRIRVTVLPERQAIQAEDSNQMVEAVELLDKTPGQEIMVPGDNPNVITVGDTNTYSASGPTMDGRMKPEIILEKSDATFSDGRTTAGTSNAAAMFAGIAAVLKANRADLTHGRLVEYARRLVQQTPARPTVSLPVYNVTFQEVLRMHRPLLMALQEVVGEWPVISGRFQDGHYVVGYTRSHPAEITQRICGQPLVQNPAPDTQYFLGFGQVPTLPPLCQRAQQQGKQIICCARTPETPYPWRLFGVSTREFLEIRHAKPNEPQGGQPQQPTSSARTWRTPTPQELPGLYR
jgi:hypothetical protein